MKIDDALDLTRRYSQINYLLPDIATRSMMELWTDEIVEQSSPYSAEGFVRDMRSMGLYRSGYLDCEVVRMYDFGGEYVKDKPKVKLTLLGKSAKSAINQGLIWNTLRDAVDLEMTWRFYQQQLDMQFTELEMFQMVNELNPLFDGRFEQFKKDFFLFKLTGHIEDGFVHADEESVYKYTNGAVSKYWALKMFDHKHQHFDMYSEPYWFTRNQQLKTG